MKINETLFFQRGKANSGMKNFFATVALGLHISLEAPYVRHVMHNISQNIAGTLF